MLSEKNLLIFRLVTSGLLPVIASVLLYQAQKKNRFGKMSYKYQQIVIGIIFGIIASLSTEFGIPYEGAVINIRNAAPLSAGLIFGGPAGLIAGFIGGIHRWISVWWGISEYSRLACTLGTILAGIIGALGRKFMFDNKKAYWLYGLLIGISTEVFHMLLVFLTKMNDIETAFIVVQKCAMPMIVGNSVSVMCAMILVTLLAKEKIIRRKEKKQITQIFQTGLLICVLIAFLVTSFFTYYLQDKITENEIHTILKLNTEAVSESFEELVVNSIVQHTTGIARDYLYRKTGEPEEDVVIFKSIADEYDIYEMHLVDADGTFVYSTQRGKVGHKLGSQFKDFASLLGYRGLPDKEHAILMPYNSEIGRSYTGCSVGDGSVLIAGHTKEYTVDSIREFISLAAHDRYVGKTGYIMVSDEDGNIVSTSGEIGATTLAEAGLSIGDVSEGTVFTANTGGKDVYCMYEQYPTIAGDYSVISVYPAREALFSKNIAVYIGLFMEIVVFSVLFVNIYFLIKRVVVDNIHKINDSLARITGGNLNTTVDVRANQEFASLSDDINATVKTLRHYISEAEARIDRELEFAKNIQQSALPGVFPPYPNRKDFSIYASMDAAREVGGDFYDFYMLGEDKLAFLIADVSGKGIPAALFMMNAKALIKGFAESGLPVDEVFTKANEKLCEGNDAGMFVTAWMGILDLQTGMVTYANAGHNPPVIRRKNGSYEYLKSRPNFILAGMEGMRYNKNEIQLRPGDEIYLYTDGVTEAQNIKGELFGEDRLLDSLNEELGITVEEICKKIKKDVDDFTGEADQFDDITMLSVILTERPEAASVKVKPEMSSMAEVSDFLENELAKYDVPMKISTKLMIALDEIYSNIVHYSGADEAEISCLIDDGMITLTFRDNGIPYDPMEAKEPDISLPLEEREAGGLGIFMVRKMMDSVEYMHKNGENILTLKLTMNK